MLQAVSTSLNDLVNLFFPKCCYGCGTPLIQTEELICTVCIINLPRTKYHLISENPVKIKFFGKVDIDQAVSFLNFKKSGIVQSLMHNLKYKNLPELATKLGQLYCEELKVSRMGNIDLIIPVPISKKKKRMRGYNQSDYFAKGLSQGLNIAWDENVIERIGEESQTRKTRINRWLNVKDSFKIIDKDKIMGKRILLVDDVITSGATIESCAKELINSGALKVSVAAIATA